MRNRIVLFFALVVCFCLSANIFAQKNKGVTPITLNVTFDDTKSGSLFGIGSDGGGTYEHGKQSVSAQFLSSGVLDFKSSAGIRKIKAFYSTPQGDSQTDQSLPASETAANFQILTFVNTPPFQDMFENTTRCQGIGVNIYIPGYTRTIGYQAGQGHLKKTAYAKVSRLANVNDKGVWVIESDSAQTCQPAPDGFIYDNIAMIADRKTSGKPGNDIIYGRYYMPFKITLTQQ